MVNNYKKMDKEENRLKLKYPDCLIHFKSLDGDFSINLNRIILAKTKFFDDLFLNQKPKFDNETFQLVYDLELNFDYKTIIFVINLFYDIHNFVDLKDKNKDIDLYSVLKLCVHFEFDLFEMKQILGQFLLLFKTNLDYKTFLEWVVESELQNIFKESILKRFIHKIDPNDKLWQNKLRPNSYFGQTNNSENPNTVYIGSEFHPIREITKTIKTNFGDLFFTSYTSIIDNEIGFWIDCEMDLKDREQIEHKIQKVDINLTLFDGLSTFYKTVKSFKFCPDEFLTLPTLYRYHYKNSKGDHKMKRIQEQKYGRILKKADLKNLDLLAYQFEITFLDFK